MKSLLDPSFRYIASSNTDIKKTFERVKREMQRQTANAESTPHALKHELPNMIRMQGKPSH